MIGGGPIGVLIATVARTFGTTVAVVEIDRSRRERVAALGFETVDPAAVDQAAWTERWTNGAGADVVFEVSGAEAAVLGATALVKVRGRLVVVAIHPQPRPIDLHRVFWRELTVLGARVYERRDFETAAKLLERDVVRSDELITSVVPLDRASEAFAQLTRGGAMKVLISVAAEPVA